MPKSLATASSTFCAMGFCEPDGGPLLLTTLLEELSMLVSDVSKLMGIGSSLARGDAWYIGPDQAPIRLAPQLSANSQLVPRQRALSGPCGRQRASTFVNRAVMSMAPGTKLWSRGERFTAHQLAAAC